MGLTKKAGNLLKGLGRHKHARRITRRSLDGDAELKSVEKARQPIQPEPHKKRLLASRAGAGVVRSKGKVAMAQSEVLVRQNHDIQNRRTYHQPAMEPAQTIQLVEDDDNHEEDEQSSDEYDESEDEVDDSVIEDMKRLEESFRGISQKYRLINRIGEGLFPFGSQNRFFPNSFQERFQPFTKQSN